MSDSEATPPVKRGPGRPRKVAPKVEADSAPDAWKTSESVVPEPVGPDERIGQTCDPNWEHVTYADGRYYHCENGKIVERLG